MKKMLCIPIFLLLLAVSLMASNVTADFTQGTPDIKSIGSLAFGPEGVLFVGDSQGGAVFALDLDDRTPNEANEAVEVRNIDEKIADMVGTTTKEIRIIDLAVNPISQNAYLSVMRGRGDDRNFLILKVAPSGDISEVSLENVKYSKKELHNPISMEKKDRRGRSMRAQAITDLSYSDGRLFIAGLSNEEFSSTMLVTPFPFEDKESATSLEIFHAAHERFETNSPIRTFVTYSLQDVPQVMAAYTCTPLVTFPMSEMKDGAHVKGKTVAELGSGNSPLDMLVYQNKNKDYLLIANTNRTLMKIDPDDIVKQAGITEPVSGRYETAGAGYIAIAQVGVQQIANLNSGYVLAVQRMGDGALNLRSISKDRL